MWDMENNSKSNISISRKERDELVLFLQKKFNLIENQLKDTVTFYKSLLEKLDNNIEIKEDGNLFYFLDKAGMNEIRFSDSIFIIEDITNQIEKLQLRDLNKRWENYWNPPETDALILQVPNGVTILLTHWNMLYYN
jgi:hypothetical protein